MSDFPSGSTDPSPTVSGIDAGSHMPPPIGPTTGVNPVPAPTPPPRYGGSRPGDSGRTATVVFGLILVAIGLWFFADQTLGLEMPRLRWSELWPVLLILLGAWILLSSMRRRP
ncbi:MAG TPA: DUF5668 domain-containing protein [Candidatus Limnocylindrales bacterium]|nr:DUF5668 domain-containing protein [Candidatus Limnocylindrales bacterium]